jgi:GNAT superfamily N-acetyltransferase
MLAAAYWAQGRSRTVIERSLSTSLTFGLYYEGSQVGLARVVTDYATFGWLCDVFILPDHRGNGQGKWLIETVVSHPELRHLRRLLLATRDAHGLYAQYGFTPLVAPDRWMERQQAERTV